MSGIIEITESSMLNDMQRLNVISNNLANVSTTGFKREIAVSRPFSNYLADQIVSSGTEFSAVSKQSIDLKRSIDASDGPVKFTGNPLDLLIEDEGYFEVQVPGGVAYTRAGSFTLDPRGQLVTKSGMPVNGIDGEIRLTNQTPKIDNAGRLWNGDIQIGKIKIVSLSKKNGLEKVGPGLFQTHNKNQIEILTTPNVRQGYLEASNVVMMDEMVKMIELMRHVETSQKVIKSYDEMLNDAIRTIGEF